MIEQLLADFGLNKKLGLCYQALLELGKCQIQPIARKLALPRSTVFGFLESLHEIGLIEKKQVSNKTYYNTSNPEAFSQIVVTEKSRLKKKEAAALQLKSAIEPFLKNLIYKGPEVVFKEGKTNIESMLFLYQPKWRASYKELNYFTMWGYQDHSFVESYRKWHENSWSTRDLRENICLFSNKEGYNQQKKEKIINREIRILPESVSLESSIWIHGSYVLIAQTRTDPHYALLLKDKILAINLRTIFQLLWTIGGKAKSS